VHSRIVGRVGAIALAIFCVTAIPARAQRSSEANYLTSVNTMLGRLAPASKESALAIRDSYRPFLDLLALDDFHQIEAGLANGGLVPLPNDPERFNVRVRLDGLSPIGEMDMSRQASYVSARAATIGCLLDVASRVKSGPIEVTSLVRHLGYQQQLRATNHNATDDVPTHALGMAFDIAMVNTAAENRPRDQQGSAADERGRRHPRDCRAPSARLPRRPTALPSRLVHRGLHASGHRAAVLDAA
jgi:hypothetical protein